MSKRDSIFQRKFMSMEKARKFKLLKTNRNEKINTNYKNWMPENILNIFKYSSLLLSLATATAAVKKRKKLFQILKFTTLISLIITIQTIYAKKQLNLDKKDSLAMQILQYAVDKVQVKDNDKILDVGCGSGTFGILVAKKNPKSYLTGIDNFSNGYNDFFSENIWKKNIKNEKIKNANFLYADAKKLPFDNESYDIVISNYVYHNIPGNKKDLIMESLRCLKKGGRFVIHDIFSKLKYGDLNKIISKLKEQGFEKVYFERTDRGYPISNKKAAIIGLKGSAILYGIK